MTTFLLVRHGDTDALGKYLVGTNPGWPLNQTGREQASQLALRLQTLPVKVIYTSPLTRTMETAEAIRKMLQVPLFEREALSEMDFGDWSGKSFAELNQTGSWKLFNQFRSMVRPPDGELLLEVQSRMVSALEGIRESHRNEMVVVVSHADPLRSYLAHLMGIALDHLQRFRIDPASLSVVQIDDEWRQVLALNRTETFAF